MKGTRMVASYPRVPVNYRMDLALRLEGRQGMVTQNRTPGDRVFLVTAPRSNSPFQGCHLRCHSIPFGRVLAQAQFPITKPETGTMHMGCPKAIGWGPLGLG